MLYCETILTIKMIRRATGPTIHKSNLGSWFVHFTARGLSYFTTGHGPRGRLMSCPFPTHGMSVLQGPSRQTSFTFGLMAFTNASLTTYFRHRCSLSQPWFLTHLSRSEMFTRQVKNHSKLSFQLGAPAR
jgi:hypothetical protein